jgi:hypothetical protein
VAYSEICYCGSGLVWNFAMAASKAGIDSMALDDLETRDFELLILLKNL